MSTDIETRIASLYMEADQDEPISRAIAAAHQAGLAWDWSMAEQALDRAYRIVGARNPATGYAWHCGRHPLQAALAAARRKYGLE